MRSLVVLPGKAPQWAVHHARHLADRLVEHGRVKVVFTHRVRLERSLPGETPAASVLGHAVSGYPVWTGRLSTALGLRRRQHLNVVVLWPGASQPLALLASLVARARREYLVLDLLRSGADVELTRSPWLRALSVLAHRVISNGASHSDPNASRRAVFICGANLAFAELALATTASMAATAAEGWTIELHVDPPALRQVQALVQASKRHRVSLVAGPPGNAGVAHADVVLAEAGGDGEARVREAVLRGGGGILVGSSLAARVSRVQSGAWLARRDPASIIVALEASSGDPTEPRIPMSDIQCWTSRILEVARSRDTA